jgi:hypothetical protein
VNTLNAPEREAVMEVMNEWEAIGEKRGRRQGRLEERLEVLLEDLQGRFNQTPKKLRVRLDALSLGQLKEIRQALPEFGDLSDVDRWLDEHA